MKQPLTLTERAYIRAHLSCVRHVTLDPKGPGVVRIHMIPPKKASHENPFLLLLNGAQLIPLDLSWAVLLANFMDAAAQFEGREIEQNEWESIAKAAVSATRRTYPFVSGKRLADELATMLDALIDIARGIDPEVSVGMLSLGEYADEMTAPHRMDLMVSAMTKDGAWHCNQKCLHCYAAGQPMGETAELSTEEWKTVLERLRDANIPQVTFTGGEPTLRSDLVELVRAAQWFVTRLNTNGRLLTPELCSALYVASLDSVQITLYSADAAIHNELVGAEGFADTVRGIQNAVAAGLNVSINTPLCSKNADYAATIAFAHSLGVRYATCSGLIPAGGAEGEASKTTRLSADELTEVLKAAMQKANALGVEVDFTSPGWLTDGTLRTLGLSLIPSCGACLSNMAITPDGTVVPCQSWLGGVSLGNILQTPWNEIWAGTACAEIRAESAKMEHICQLQAGNRTEKGGC